MRCTVAISAAAVFAGLAAVAAQSQGPQLSDGVFKNVQVLKGIPADEFMDVMGMFSSSLGYDCVSCHSPEIYKSRDGFAVATPAIQRARAMIGMVNAINRGYFGGEPRVSCFTCHHGSDRPEFVPNLALQYGDLVFDPNAMHIVPDRQPTVDQVFDKYLQALGGRQRLESMKSFAARGTYEGSNTGAGSKFPLEIFVKAPDQRAQLIRGPGGDDVKTYDGKNAWVAERWRPLPLMALSGGNLDGARLEALAWFPAAIRQAFSQWQSSNTRIDNQVIQILQGSNAGSLPVNFYFDTSGLLVRIVRWNRTPVGAVPIQIDYSDYRDVSGIRIPFRTVVTWTDGKDTLALDEVDANVAIEAARFARPAPFRR
jgi:photosynthetic reaction center cytochrome c subunit